MAFWIVTLMLCAVVFGAFALTLWRARAGTAPTAEFDLRVYRDQLREVERDVARGVVSSEDAARIRTEVSRRILEADKAATAASPSGDAPRGPSFAALGLAALTLVGAFGLYTHIGAPGYPDLPLAARKGMAAAVRADRPAQAVAEAEALAANPPPPEDRFDPEYLKLVDQLRAIVAERPDEIRAHEFLARQEAGMGRFAAAWKAKARANELRGAEEVETRDLAEQLNLMVLAAGGRVTPEAEDLIGQILARDPGNGFARYFTGTMFGQTGRPDLAFNIWAALLADSPPDAPWQGPIRAQIDAMATRAGVDYVAPALSEAPAPGPDRADIEAARDLGPDEQMAMIENMVAGLAERLATEGGPPADWARLIRAYGVLGRKDAALAIWTEAQSVFPDDITRVEVLQAARDAGVAQ